MEKKFIKYGDTFLSADGKYRYRKWTDGTEKWDKRTEQSYDNKQEAEWYPHREDGPARIYPDGERKWYRNGKLHRRNGSAVEGTATDKSEINGWVEYPAWRLNGQKVSPTKVFDDKAVGTFWAMKEKT